LSDDLKAAEEAKAAAGKGGKAPAKDAKKGAAKEEEVSPEELEREEKKRAEKEERERKLKEEWDQLDDETKHIRSCEDIFKEPCIKVQNSINMDKCEKL